MFDDHHDLLGMSEKDHQTYHDLVDALNRAMDEVFGDEPRACLFAVAYGDMLKVETRDSERPMALVTNVPDDLLAMAVQDLNTTAVAMLKRRAKMIAAEASEVGAVATEDDADFINGVQADIDALGTAEEPKPKFHGPADGI